MSIWELLSGTEVDIVAERPSVMLDKKDQRVIASLLPLALEKKAVDRFLQKAASLVEYVEKIATERNGSGERSRARRANAKKIIKAIESIDSLLKRLDEDEQEMVGLAGIAATGLQIHREAIESGSADYSYPNRTPVSEYKRHSRVLLAGLQAVLSSKRNTRDEDPVFIGESILAKQFRDIGGEISSSSKGNFYALIRIFRELCGYKKDVSPAEIAKLIAWLEKE